MRIIPIAKRLMFVALCAVGLLATALAWRAWAAPPGKIDTAALRVLIEFAAGQQAEAASSENNKQFAQWLTQFPAADANGDGVLTQPEALAFIDLIESMQTTKVRRNLVYRTIDGASLKLDVYLPPNFDQDDDARYPGVLYIHGGGWASGSKNNTPQVMQLLASHGYVVASINYRLAPKHTFPAQVEDARAALAWMAEHADDFQIDKQRLAVMGGSAGGHLALLVGLMDSKTAGDEAPLPPVRAIVNIFGPTDLTTGDWPQSADSLLVQFMGGSLKDAPRRYQEASPVTYIDRDDPPVLTLHGTKDPLVPFRQAEILHDRLTAAGVDSQLEAIEGAGHGWGEPDLSRTLRMTVAFLDKHVKNGHP
ncbi:MAG: alpha/beta hydrolase [Pirellulales bacterium]